MDESSQPIRDPSFWAPGTVTLEDRKLKVANGSLNSGSEG